MKLFYINKYYKGDDWLNSEVHIFNNYYDAYKLFLNLLKIELWNQFYTIWPDRKREADKIQAEDMYQRLITSEWEDIKEDWRIYNLSNDTFYLDDDSNWEYTCTINLLPYELE